MVSNAERPFRAFMDLNVKAYLRTIKQRPCVEYKAIAIKKKKL